MLLYKMKSYYLKLRKDTENTDSKVSGTSNGRVMILLKCSVCVIKKQEDY